MTGVSHDIQIWLYPEEIELAGAKRLARLASDLGVGAVSVALTYHQCMRVFPRYGAVRPGAPGGLHFEPARRGYGPLAPRPSPAAVGAERIAELRAACETAGVGFRAWIVALDNEALAAENPNYAAQTLDGTPTFHSLCPSHPEVRAYLRALVEDVIDLFAPDLIELEAATYPRWNGYLAEIALVPLSLGTRRYGAQCLCNACQAVLGEDGIRADHARAVLAAAAGPPIGGGTDDDPALIEAIAAVRDRVVAGLLAEVRDSLPNSTQLRILGLGAPDDMRLQGLGTLSAAAVDDVLIGLGTLSGEELQEQLRAHITAGARPPGAVGINWTPDRDGQRLGDDAIAALKCGLRGVSFYNLSLLPETGLDDVRAAISLLRAAADREMPDRLR